MGLQQADLIALYRRLAPSYDLTSNLYWAVGFPMRAFRRAAVHAFCLWRALMERPRVWPSGAVGIRQQVPE